MKSHKKLLSLILSVSTLLCCFTNLFVMASDIDVSNYTYVVDNMTFYKGENEIDSLDGATEVAVDVTRRVAGGDSDRLIISTYSDTGEYIGMYSVTHHIDFGKTSNVKVLLNIPEEKTVGEVKAYVWKSFSDMIPLSNVLSSNNNMIIDPKLEYEKELQTTFTDVSVNDSFAEAVSLITYLGIMNGYEDGTFRPTSNIRVADAARMITYMTKGEFLASLFEEEKLVEDEIPSSIERGYINYCVDSKYLIPDANGYVNYNENITVKDFFILTMNALGYYTMATASGGWPRGYVNLATELGFENLTEYNYSADITRAEAVKILAHAVNAPIAIAVGYSYTASGEIVEKYVKQDGMSGTYYQSILTKYFEMYTIEGYVLDTYKTDSTFLNTDEVEFGIASSKNYNNDDVSFDMSLGSIEDTFGYGVILDAVKVGNTAAANNIGVYASAIVKLTDEDEWTFISFTPSKNITVELDASLLTDESDTDALRFWTDDTETKSVEYNLDASTVVYVNGFKAYGSLATALSTYVTSLDNGKITLIDTYRTDGQYDIICVDAYARDMVTAISGDEIIMTATTLDLDKEANEDLEYHIYYNGEEITIAELKEDDVLSIAYDIRGDIENSDYYEIYVSRDTVTGTLTKKPDMAATIDDTKYEFVSQADYDEFICVLNLGDQVTLYLDYFGNIYDWEFDYSSLNWGIAEKFTLSSSDDNYKLTIFTDDGTTKQYYFDAYKTKVIMPDGIQLTSTGTQLITAVQDMIYASPSIKSEITNRVIQYKINSATSKISELKFVDWSSGSDYPEEFDERTYKIGSVRLGNNTKIIDACYYYNGELSTTKVSDLYDGAKYQVYGYGDKVDGVYLFTLITSTNVSPMNYAIVEGFTEGNTLETCYINLYNPEEDCHEQIPFTENSKITTPLGGTFYADEYYILDDFWDEITSIIYEDNTNLADITQRVVSYRILYDSTGDKIENIKFLDYTSLVTKLTAFDSETNTIGNIELSDNALMVDVSAAETDDIYVYIPQSFADGRKCKAYAYNKDSNGKYPFVLITEADAVENYKFGIAEKFTLSTSDDDYKLTIFTDDGTTEQYFFDANKATVTLPDGTIINKDTEGSANALNAAVRALVYSDYAKNDIKDRVIQYKVNSSTGKLSEVNFITAEAGNGDISTAYDATRSKIGAIRLSTATKIIDARNQKLSSASIADLYDGTSYEAYAYGDIENGAYPFVLITMANMSDKAYAIADRFIEGNSIDTSYIDLYNAEEEITYTYHFDATNSIITYSDGTTKYTSDYTSVSDFCQTMYSLANADVNITERIVSYRVNYEKGSCIEELTFLPYSLSSVTDTETTARYHYASKTIGDISLTDDALIVDASEDSYMTYNLVSFVNGAECVAYAYDLSSDKKSPFVIVTAITSMPDVPVNWGIAEKFTLSVSDDNYKLTIFTAEGITKAYYFDASKANVTLPNGNIINKITEGSEYALTEKVKNLIYSDIYSTTRQSIENRVIQYKVSASSGMITELKFISPSADTLAGTFGKEAYNARANTIGSISLGEKTKMIDATEYMANSDLCSMSYTQLTDGTRYGAFAYGEKVDNIYPFVLVTEGPSPYTSETRFAVVTEDGAVPTFIDGDETFYEIKALYGENDVVSLIATDEDETDLLSLKAGDVIFFKTNSAGQIKYLDVIFSFDDGFPTYSELASMSLVNDNEDNNVSGITITSTGANFGTGVFTQDWDAAIKVNDTVKLVYGPIAEVTKNSISFAKIVDGETDLTTDVQEYDIAPEINVYKYDFGSTAKFKFSATTKTTGAAIVASRFLTKLIQENDDVIDWDDATAKHYEKANFAFALVVEDEVVEIFEFIAE